MIRDIKLRYLILTVTLSGCQTIGDVGNLVLSGIDNVKEQFSQDEVKEEKKTASNDAKSDKIKIANGVRNTYPSGQQVIEAPNKLSLKKKVYSTATISPSTDRQAVKKREIKPDHLKKDSLLLSGVISQEKVVDGDTIKLDGKRIRLFGIDAPELRQTCEVKGRVTPCGIISKEALIGFSAGSVVKCKSKDRDRYGRVVGQCFVKDLDLSAAMVRAGLAVAYRKYSYTYVREERIARTLKAGIWKGTFVMPWDWRSQRK